MELKPLKNYRKPLYPELPDFRDNNKLLTDNLPERWKYKKALSAAVMTFLINTGTSCKDNPVPVNDYELYLEKKASECKRENQDNQQQCLVAPLFLHGEGRGTVGCMVVQAPVFMSESDAYSIIIQEFAKRGIALEEGIDIKEIQHETWVWDSVNHQTKDTIINHHVECYSQKYNLGVEFASEKDYSLLRLDKSGSTVYRINTKEAANVLRDKFDETDKYNIVIFYDPVEKTEADSKAMLIKQIDDFFDWLAKQ